MDAESLRERIEVHARFAHLLARLTGTDDLLEGIPRGRYNN